MSSEEDSTISNVDDTSYYPYTERFGRAVRGPTLPVDPSSSQTLTLSRSATSSPLFSSPSSRSPSNSPSVRIVRARRVSSNSSESSSLVEESNNEETPETESEESPEAERVESPSSDSGEVVEADSDEVPEVRVEASPPQEYLRSPSSPSPKRRRTEDVKIVVTEDNDPTMEEDDDGCSICYEEYHSSGEHRLVSLKCGHFFGKSCIMRWIRSEGRTATCPTCKAKAGTRDVRTHFTKTVKLLDTAELELLRENKIILQRKVADLELDLVKYKRLADEFKDKMQKKDGAQPFVLARRAGRILLTALSKVSLTREATGYSRAFDYNGSIFAVGVGDLNNLFGTFGIKTLTWEKMSLKVKDVHPCHSLRARVVQFCPFEQTLLFTGGEDRRVIVQDVGQKRLLKKYTVPCQRQVWAGCWLSREKLVAGCMDGRVFLYNITSESEHPEKDVTDNIGKVPIIYLAYDARLDLLLICSVKTFVVIHNERVFTLCQSDPGETIRSATWDESSLHVMLSLKGPAGFTHKLFRLGIDEATNVVTMADVDSITCVAYKCSTYWYNVLFSTDKGLFAVVYNEDKQSLECFDWTRKRSNVAISFNMGNPSMMLALPGSNSDSRIIFILTEISVFVLNFQIND